MSNKNVSFRVSTNELVHIKTILDRAKALGLEFDRKSADMDLSACHANGCPMDFEGLAKANDSNLLHDFWGITEHMDRTTGQLTDYFRPRFALKQSSTNE